MDGEETLRSDGKRRIQLFPAGPITTVDGAEWDFTPEDLEAVAEALNEKGQELPVFLDHMTYSEPVGWVSEFHVTADGLFGWVRWLDDDVIERIRAEELKYTSPGFYLDDAGHLMSVYELSLTNIPRMQGMQPVEAAIQKERGARAMNRAQIVKALAGLPGETDPEKLRAHVIASLSLSDSTTWAEILACLSAEPEAPNVGEQVTAAVNAALVSADRRWEAILARERQATEAALARKQANVDFCRTVQAKVVPAAREQFAGFVASLTADQFSSLKDLMAKMPNFVPGRAGVARASVAATRFTADDVARDPELASQLHADTAETMAANPGMKYHEALAIVNKGAN